MHIYIKEAEGKTIKFRFPTRILFNSLSASLLPSIIGKHLELPSEEKLSASDFRLLVRTLHACKRRHPDLYLVDIQSSDGDTVQIKL